MHQRQVEEATRERMDLLVLTELDRLFDQRLYVIVVGKGFGCVAEGVARHLIEQEHEREALPGRSRTSRRVRRVRRDG